MNDVTAVRGHAGALKFVADGGSELSDMLAGIANAKDVERGGVIKVFGFFAEHYAGDGDVHLVPVPGTKKGETGNLPYDKYTTKVKSKDGDKNVPGSFYTDAVKNTSEATRVFERIAQCEGGENVPEDIQKMGTVERRMEVKRLRQRLTDMRTALVKGAQLFIHAHNISTINPERIKVKMPFKMVVVNDKQTMVPFANTIRLQDPTGEFEDKIYTTSEFLRIDLDKLSGTSNQQTIVTLDNTKARAPKVKTGKGQQEVKPATSVEALLSLFNVVSTSIDTETEHGNKLNTALLAACSAPGTKGDDVVETIGDFAMAVDAIWTVIDKRYQGIKARRAASLNTRAQHDAEVKRLVS